MFWEYLKFLSPFFWARTVWVHVRAFEYIKVAISSAVAGLATIAIGVGTYFYAPPHPDIREELTQLLRAEIKSKFGERIKKLEHTIYFSDLQFEQSSDQIQGTKSISVLANFNILSPGNFTYFTGDAIAVFGEQPPSLFAYLRGQKIATKSNYFVVSVTHSNVEEVKPQGFGISSMRFLPLPRGGDLLWFELEKTDSASAKGFHVLQKHTLSREWLPMYCETQLPVRQPAETIDIHREGESLGVPMIADASFDVRQPSPNTWHVIELIEPNENHSKSKGYTMLVWEITSGGCILGKRWNGGKPLTLTLTQLGTESEVMTAMYERRKDKSDAEVVPALNISPRPIQQKRK